MLRKLGESPIDGIKRIVFLAFLILVLVTSGDAGFASHRSTLRAAYSSLGLPQAPLWIAFEAGYLKEVGLSIEMPFIQNSSTVIQSLLSGEIDYAMVGATPVVAAGLQGADVLMIATTIPTMIFSLVVRPDIHRVDDLKRKAIGFGRFGSNTDFAARLLLEKYRLIPGKDVSLVPTGGGASTIVALRTGKIQAGVTTEVGMLEARKLGFKELVAFKDLGIPFSHNGFAARRSFLKNHELDTLNFLRAVSKGIYRMLGDRDFSTHVIRKISRTEDRSIVEASYEAHAGRFLQKVPYTTPTMIQTVLRQIAETVPAAQNANPAIFIDNRYIQALEQKGLYADLEEMVKRR